MSEIKQEYMKPRSFMGFDIKPECNGTCDSIQIKMRGEEALLSAKEVTVLARLLLLVAAEKEDCEEMEGGMQYETNRQPPPPPAPPPPRILPAGH